MSDDGMKKRLLQALPAQTLREFANGWEVEVEDSRRIDSLVDALMDCELQPKEILGELKREELKALCRELELDDKGKTKQTLIDRLLAADDPGTPTANGIKESSRRNTTVPSRARSASDPLRPWGPDNPHPLSTMKTELVWEGKYDEWGNRRTVDAAGLAMPMQRIETIDQPRSEAIASGKFALFEKQNTRLDDFRNRLIWGDNKLVMASLLKEFKGRIDLIYIDPPFDVGADFTMDVPLGDSRETVGKDQSALEMVAYNDMWGRGASSYLATMYERLVSMHDLLSPNGSIWVHCDWRVNGYIRLMLDEVFGHEHLRNEVVWKYSGGRVGKRFFGRKHDTLFWYSKSDSWKFYPDRVRDEYASATVERFSATIRNVRDGRDFGDQELNPEGKYPEDVFDISIEAPSANVRTGYPTQKPRALLERILLATSDEGDLVADFFTGSGTTVEVAERLKRTWIACDLGRFAIHTTRKRLIDIQRTLSAETKPYRAFDVYNLGRYERQWWQHEALKGADEEHRRVVLEFFRAEVLDPKQSSSPLIHGRKGRAVCHVDGIDSIFTSSEARAVAKAASSMGAKECYCLAWDFEMDIRQKMAAIEQEFGLKLYPVKIPREVMERNRKASDHIPWMEVAVLEAEAVTRKGSGVDIKLTRFLPSLAEVPPKELEAIEKRAVTSGFDFIDFWAVDFDWSADRPFNHHWQDYRTRKDRSLKTVSDAGYEYPKKGKYQACVKVVDVFGFDTSVLVRMKG